MVINMKVAFFCWTKYNLFCAVQMKYTYYPEDDVDLYVMCVKKVAIEPEIWNHLREKKLFKEIIFVNSNEFIPGNRWDLVKIIFRCKGTFRLRLREKYYDEFYIYKLDELLTPIIYTELKKLNLKIKCNIYEEGPGLAQIYKIKRKRKCLFAFGRVHDPVKKEKIKYWIRYKGAEIKTRAKDIEWKEAPQFDKKDYAKIQLMNDIFGYKPDERLSKAKLVIMEQECSEGKEFLPVSSDIALFEKIGRSIGYDKTVAKLHPRSLYSRFSENIYVLPDEKSSFEIACINESFNDKIFVTVSSTSVYLPKIISGDEPYIIFLGEYIKFADTDYLCRGKKYYIQNRKRLENLYLHKEKFISIKNDEDFQNILDWLSDMGDKNNVCG